MSTNFFVDKSRSPNGQSANSTWLYVSALLTGLYVIFALVLVGVPQVSRLGLVVVLVSLVWLIMGVITRRAKFPKILILALCFYLLILISGLVMPIYPIEYAGQVTTIWVGGIVIAAFVANGVSINLLLLGFVVVFIANFVAINVGYDTYQLYQKDSSLDTIAQQGVSRASGLSGHPNLLISLVFTLPFLLFLNKRSYAAWVFLACVAGGIAIAFATGSRSAIPFTMLFAGFGSLFLIRNRFLRLAIICTGVVLAISFFGFLKDPYYQSKIVDSAIGDEVIVQRIMSALDETDNSSETRQALATEFWPHFYRKPIFGYGPGQFANVAGDGLYAHNNFAEIAVNWGLVGLLVFYSLYGAVIAGIFLQPNINYFIIAPLAFLIMADFAFVAFLDRPMVLCLCLMLVVLFGSESSRKRKRRRRSEASYF